VTVERAAGDASDGGDGAGTAVLVLLLLLGVGTAAVLAAHRKMARPIFLGDPGALPRRPAGALALLAGALAAVKAVGRRRARDSDGLPAPPHPEPAATNGLLHSADAKPPAAAASSSVRLQPWDAPFTSPARTAPPAPAESPPLVADRVPARPATSNQPVWNGGRTGDAPTPARITDPRPAGERRDGQLEEVAPAKRFARTAAARSEPRAPWDIPIGPAEGPASEPQRPPSKLAPG